MRVQTNEQAIKTRTTGVQRASIIGIVVLVAAVIVSFRPSIPYYIPVAYSLSLIGLFVVSWSSVMTSKWIGDLRGDQLLAKALKGLGGDYYLYNYHSPVDHLLVSSAGCTVLTLKRVDGQVTCRGEKWRRPLNFGRVVRALSEEQLGNPTRQAQTHLKAVESWLQKELPDFQVPTNAVIVFVHPKVELQVSDPVIPVTTIGDLKVQLRAQPTERKLSSQALKTLTKLLDDYAA